MSFICYKCPKVWLESWIRNHCVIYKSGTLINKLWLLRVLLFAVFFPRFCALIHDVVFRFKLCSRWDGVNGCTCFAVWFIATWGHVSFFIMVMYVTVPFTCDAPDGMRVNQWLNQSSKQYLVSYWSDFGPHRVYDAVRQASIWLIESWVIFRWINL